MNNVVDIKFMKQALDEAQKSLSRGDFPIGAVLVIDGKLIGKINNALLSKATWGDHAENQLILKNSQLIRESKKGKDSQIDLYTTLEPCLMCLGCATLHRINRIIYACPDPRGGAANLDLSNLPSFYKDYWPRMESGLFKEDAYKMLMKFMVVQQTPQWKKNKVLFEEMASNWVD